MKCSKCGKKIVNKSNFCPECGEHIPEKRKNRKWVVLLLVCILMTTVVSATFEAIQFHKKESDKKIAVSENSVHEKTEVINDEKEYSQKNNQASDKAMVSSEENDSAEDVKSQLKSYQYSWNGMNIKIFVPVEMEACDFETKEYAEHFTISVLFSNCMVTDIYMATESYFDNEKETWSLYETTILAEQDGKIVFDVLPDQRLRNEPEKADFPYSDEILKEYKNVISHVEELVRKIEVSFEDTKINKEESVIDNTGIEVTYSISEICEMAADYYNQKENTDVYVVFEEECTNTADGYFLVLRTQGGNTANTIVTGLMINTETGQMTDDWGNTVKLY